MNKPKTFQEWIKVNEPPCLDSLWSDAEEVGRNKMQEEVIRTRRKAVDIIRTLHKNYMKSLSKNRELKYKNSVLKKEIDKRDALVQEVLDQKNRTYGMGKDCAIHFRMRRVFSILEYDYMEKLTKENKNG